LLKNLIKKGPVLRAFFFIFLLILFNCTHSKNIKQDKNFFSNKQKSNVEIFTVRDFYTQGKFQLYFDVFNKNEDVTIGRMALYVFNKDCDQVPDDATSNEILYSNHVFIGPYKNGVITFFPRKRLKCYTVKGFEKYL
jgi:hypothetical protein